MENSKEGYIYIYKCIMGSHSDICKIGKTKYLSGNKSRLKQHGRTPYYGFIPYCEFDTGNPIATAFKVKNMNNAEKLVNTYFKEYQLSTIEIYNIDYDDAIKNLYTMLTENNEYLDIKTDGYSIYDFLNALEDEQTGIDTTKARFEKIKQDILLKYPAKFPEELLLLLKDKERFSQNCSSHYKSGNYVEFPGGLVLDIHFNKAKRTDILNKLMKLL